MRVISTLVALGLTASLAGCSSSEPEKPRSQSLLGPSYGSPQGEPGASASGKAGGAKATTTPLPSEAWVAPSGTVELEDAPAASARDLVEELRDALASVPACFRNLVSDRPLEGRVPVTVHVRVLEDGRVTESTVTAPGAPESALRCAEGVARGVRLRAPIPDAPRQLSASASLELTAVAIPNAPPPREEPRPASPNIVTLGTVTVGLPPEGAQGQPIQETPGQAPVGGQGAPIQEAPGSVQIEGPSGLPPSN